MEERHPFLLHVSPTALCLTSRGQTRAKGALPRVYSLRGLLFPPAQIQSRVVWHFSWSSIMVIRHRARPCIDKSPRRTPTPAHQNSHMVHEW